MFPLLIAVPLLALGLLAPVLQIDFTDFRAVLIWLAGAGAPYIVGYLVSLLAENWPKWHDLPRAVKFFTPMIFSLLLSVGATLLLNYPEVIGAISPWWAIVVAAILAYLGTQNAYIASKRAGYGYGPKASEKRIVEEIVNYK